MFPYVNVSLRIMVTTTKKLKSIHVWHRLHSYRESLVLVVLLLPVGCTSC